MIQPINPRSIDFPAWLADVSPTWRWDWPHLRAVQDRLQAVTEGSCRRLMLYLPPRHGKSEMTTIRYPVWRLEQDPTLRVIIACYGQALAETFSRRARRLAESRLALSKERAAAGDWETEAGGGMRAVGVGTGVAGRGAQLVIVDDPIKSREEADSEAYRERVGAWFTDDLYTRLEPDGAIVLIQTRWHEDDLAGRLLAAMEGGGEQWEVLSLPALAEEDDPLGRPEGAPLCPDRYDVAALEGIRTVLGTYSFSALYQQRPGPREGGFFKWAWFRPAAAKPALARRVRYWDTAGTEGAGDYTAGVLMSRTAEGIFTVEHVHRGQWSPGRRDQEIVATAKEDGTSVSIWLEQESGVGGQDRSAATIRALAGYTVHAEHVTGSKESRADPLAAQAEAGNVRVLTGDWVHRFLSELASFPTGSHDDQVDAASGAFAKLAAGDGYARPRAQAGTPRSAY